MINIEKSGIFYCTILWRRTDVWILGLLIATVMLYQLQFIIPQITYWHVRELIYLYLYIRIVLFYRPKPNSLSKLFIALIIFLFLATLVGLHTYCSHGITVAIHGFTRFIHLALLAPLVALIIVDVRDIKVILSIWMAVVFIGTLTVAYQIWGGEMPWLVQNYIAIRGDLVRHKSLMGEPNVGGMAAVLAYTLATLMVRNVGWRYAILLSSSFLVIVCLSKAALASFIIANILIFILDCNRRPPKRSLLPSKALRQQFLVTGIWYLVLYILPLTRPYFKVAANSLVGKQYAVPGALEDLSSRFFYAEFGGANNFQDVIHQLASIIFGQSFGRAGSAALELKVLNSVGPHNMYLEIYLVGGILFLSSFFLVQILTFATILKKFKQISLPYHAALPLLFMLCLYMTGYPIVYEPTTGTLFWIIVGICASKKLAESNTTSSPA